MHLDHTGNQQVDNKKQDEERGHVESDAHQCVAGGQLFIMFGVAPGLRTVFSPFHIDSILSDFCLGKPDEVGCHGLMLFEITKGLWLSFQLKAKKILQDRSHSWNIILGQWAGITG